MPRNSREPTLARQWELLKLIPRHRPGATARELCERLKNAGHGVTKRTVERDLLELSIPFQLMCNDAAMPYGWYWKSDASFDIPGIALDEMMNSTQPVGLPWVAVLCSVRDQSPAIRYRCTPFPANASLNVPFWTRTVRSSPSTSAARVPVKPLTWKVAWVSSQYIAALKTYVAVS